MTEAALARSSPLACARCGQPLEYDDFGDLGLRPPDHDQSRQDYLDAQLLDSVSHLHCIDAAER